MALRFDPPPGWPAPPLDWEPPEGWQPDPEWPAAPEGWTFWVEDGAPGPTPPQTQPPAAPEPAPVVYWSEPSPPVTWAPQNPQAPQAPQADLEPPAQPFQQPVRGATGFGFHRAQWFGLAAALTVVLGSIVPFVSYEDTGLPRTWQVRPGALVASFFFGLLLTALVVFTQHVRLRTAACLALLGLGLLGFCGYMVFSVVGLTSGTPDQFSGRTVHWSPGPGLVLCIIGTGAIAVLSVLILRIPKVSPS
jgi:hypothetical protein